MGLGVKRERVGVWIWKPAYWAAEDGDLAWIGKAMTSDDIRVWWFGMDWGGNDL